jgi:hypothetical protein
MGPSVLRFAYLLLSIDLLEGPSPPSDGDSNRVVLAGDVDDGGVGNVIWKEVNLPVDFEL